MGSSKQPKVPDAPELEKASESYKKGIKTDLEYAPALARTEFQLRKQYGPKYAKIATRIYKKNAKKIAVANLDALRRVDPESIDGRKQLYGAVSEDLSHGSKLDPELQGQVTQYIRAAQAARGNTLGAGPEDAEALYVGEKGRELYQQRLSNMGSFLSAPTPEDRFGSLLGGAGPGLTGAASALSSPGFQYVNRGAGAEGVGIGQADNETALAQWKLSGAGNTAGASNPWMRALKGASVGAAEGGTFGPYGAIGGAIGGAVDGAANGPIYRAKTGT